MPNLKTITDLLDQEIDSLSDFYRALPRQYQHYFKRLIDYMNHHIQAIRVAESALPMELFLLTISLEQEKAIYLLQDEVKYLRTELEKLSKPQG